MAIRSHRLRDAELLEAVDLEAPDGGADAPVGRAPANVRRAGRTAVSRRRWAFALACGAASIVSLAEAGRRLEIERDADDVAAIWAEVRAVDGDLAFAERRVDEVRRRFGASRGLEQQRAGLFLAAEARFRTLLADLEAPQPLHTSSRYRSRASSLLADVVVDTDAGRTRDSSTVRMGDIAADLKRDGRQVRTRGRSSDARLPEATSLVQTLSQYADIRTGLTIGGLDRAGRFWIIDVDRNSSFMVDVPDLPRSTSVTAYADQFVFAGEDGRLRSYHHDTAGALTKTWERAGGRTTTSSDGSHLLVHSQVTVEVVDSTGSTGQSFSVPNDARFVVANADGSGLLAVRGVGFVSRSFAGELDVLGPTEDGSDPYDDVPVVAPNRSNRAGLSGAYADEDDGSIRIVRYDAGLEGRPGLAMVLRADLPPMRAVTVMP